MFVAAEEEDASIQFPSGENRANLAGSTSPTVSAVFAGSTDSTGVKNYGV